MTSESFDLIIIGGGPAGLTAAIYASRMGMKSVLLERSFLGGRAAEAPIVENFPGFSEEISGTELTGRMVKQAEKFGVDFRFPEEVIDLILSGKVKTVVTKDSKYNSYGIIVATGTQSKRLLLSGETEFLGRGVSYCTVCDGPLFKDRVTAVVGSGDEAFEDAFYLSSLSRSVVVITRKEEIEAAKTLVDKCRERDNVKVLKAEVKAINGDGYVKSVMISDLKSKSDVEMPIDGVFISVGRVPMTNLVKKAGVAIDERGCIRVDRRQGTNVEGVFAAGDCTCGGMQIVTAVGEGAMAAMQAYRYVRNVKR